MKKLSTTFLIFLFTAPGLVLAQRQYADTTYLPPPFEPAYKTGKGPVVHIDEAHNNFHTKNGRYRPFANVLEADGFRVEANTEEFNKKTLKNIDILVISNALHETSLEQWVAPTQSAFTEDEINALEQWVEQGGNLFLISDHMPMAGAAKDVASVFGYSFYDSFADDTTTRSGPDLFTKGEGGLSENLLTNGGDNFFEVDSVTTYTGQAFELPETATSILNTGEGWVVALPDTAWIFNDDTRIISAEGWSQGAFQKYGKGKIVFLGKLPCSQHKSLKLMSNKSLMRA